MVNKPNTQVWEVWPMIGVGRTLFGIGDAAQLFRWFWLVSQNERFNQLLNEQLLEMLWKASLKKGEGGNYRFHVLCILSLQE